jgi:UDP-2,4-diacetamido-2,4,6-trideoxy-beta-L-altropyranose hydrolase
VTGEPPLLIRADATSSMGTGHAMRCLSLAQAWRDAGGSCLFAMAETTPAVRQRVETENCEVVSLPVEPGGSADASQFEALARARNSSRVVVDGYQFGADYQRRLKSAGMNTLFIDDYGHAEHYSADFVLNQNISADERLYANRAPCTKLLLGPRFAMLRREFNAWREFMREIPPIARKVLVTLGGSDPENFTAIAVEAVASVQIENMEAMIVVGGSNPHFDSLQRSALKVANQRVKIIVKNDVSNMAQQMAWADVAISAAGTTCWELCLLALPSLLIDVAPNQIEVARELHRRQCAIHVGSAREISVQQLSNELERVLRSEGLRRTLSAHSRQLVDGNGARRVVSLLRGEDGIRLRPAKADDARLLFDWANDPQVRAAAFSSVPIIWESHAAWFSEKLNGGKCFIWIAEDWEGSPLGQIRFDVREDGESEVDISITKAKRGQGLAHTLIELGVDAFFKANHGGPVHALVKEDNPASIRAFEKAGFRRAGTVQARAVTAINFIYERK